MIEEQGTIIRNSKCGIAFISTEKGSECDGCGSKALCNPGEGPDKTMVVEASNPMGASVGERVVFTVGAATVLRAGMMLYLVPLLSFIAGVVVGQVFGPKLLPDMNLGSCKRGARLCLCSDCSFVGLRFYGKRRYEQYLQADRVRPIRPTIVRSLNSLKSLG